MSTTSDVGLTAIARALRAVDAANEEDRRIQAGIDAAMRGVIAEQVSVDPTRIKNPTAPTHPPFTNQPKPPQGTGLDQALLVPDHRNEGAAGQDPRRLADPQVKRPSSE